MAHRGDAQPPDGRPACVRGLGAEQKRRAHGEIFGFSNSQKAIGGYYAALLDAKAMAAKAEEEGPARGVAADPGLARSIGDPWATVAGIQQKLAPRAMDARLVGFGGSQLLGIAGETVQYVAEEKKPNEKRYEEYVDANLDSLQNELLSPAPVYADIEAVTWPTSSSWPSTSSAPTTPFVEGGARRQDAGRGGEGAIAGTKLRDVAVRKALLEGGRGGGAASTDPMIVLARRLDPMARETRKLARGRGGRPATRAMEKIAQARWKIYGRTVSPDATFTLRLSYGTVKGYPDNGTRSRPSPRSTASTTAALARRQGAVGRCRARWKRSVRGRRLRRR